MYIYTTNKAIYVTKFYACICTDISLCIVHIPQNISLNQDIIAFHLTHRTGWTPKSFWKIEIQDEFIFASEKMFFYHLAYGCFF